MPFPVCTSCGKSTRSHRRTRYCAPCSTAVDAFTARFKYNGWTNYATWLVNVRIFDWYDSNGAPVTGNMLSEKAFNLLQDSSREGLALDFALEFLRDVNWEEIAHWINTDGESVDYPTAQHKAVADLLA